MSPLLFRILVQRWHPLCFSIAVGSRGKMKKAWLLKSSQVKTLVRAFGFLLFSAIILVQFQNCAPAQMKTEDSKSGSTKASLLRQLNTSTTKSPSGSGGGFGTSNGGSSSGGSSSSGVALAHLLAEAPARGGFGGGGSSSGGSSGGSGSQGIYFVNQPLQSQSTSLQVFQIEARVSGERLLTLSWYKDNAALTQKFYILSLVADNWNIEGSYYVVAKTLTVHPYRALSRPRGCARTGRRLQRRNLLYSFLNNTTGII